MKDHFPLTALQLQFHCLAETPLNPGGLQAGSNLRGALLDVMRRATCALTPGPSPKGGGEIDPEHAKTCPVCWLVAAHEHPGEERRGYVLTPPQPAERRLQPGEPFSFSLTLFGEAQRFLPYFVLALPEVGRLGFGPGRGKFRLDSIVSLHPVLGPEPVLEPGKNIVHPPKECITHAHLARLSEEFAPSPGREMSLHFETPLRIIHNKKLLKSPDFGIFFATLLKRLDDLALQHAGGQERNPAAREKLWNAANRVRLIESQARWVEVKSGSSRTGQETWLSGLLGPARYSASPEIWQVLLPWLLWGQLAQVGKDAVKGNGVYRMLKV